MTIPNDNVPTLPFLHQNMPDRPNTIFPSTLALKQAFDSSTIALQTAINALVADLLASGANVSASEFIGSRTVPNVTGNTLWDQLVYMSNQIQSIVGGAIPPQTVTTAMLQDGAVTTIKIANNAVTFEKLSQDRETASIGGQIYAYYTQGGF